MALPLSERNVGFEPGRGEGASVLVGSDRALVREEGGARLVEQPEHQPETIPLAIPPYRQPKQYQVRLVDRHSELNNAGRTLDERQSVQLYGSAGSGKTVLLHYIANHIPASKFPDGIVSLLVPGYEFDDLSQLLFDTFYETSPLSWASTQEIRDALQMKRALILLDEVDLNQTDLERLLELVPNATFLMASERSLPYTQWQTIAISELPRQEALELAEFALKRRLTSSEHSITNSLVGTLGAHPLSILQLFSFAAARRQDLQTVAQQLQAHAADHEEMLISAQPERAQGILGALAAFEGVSLTLDQLANVTGMSGNLGPTLQSLVDEYVVTEARDRYRLARNLQEAVSESLDLNIWVERGINTFVSWAGTHRGSPATILTEADVLLKVLERTVRAENWPQTLQLVQALDGPLMSGKRWSSWERVLKWGLQAARAQQDQDDEAWAQHQLGTRALCLGNENTARSHLNLALSLREEFGDPIGVEVTRHNLRFLGDPPMPPMQPPPPPPPPPPSPPRYRPPQTEQPSRVAGFLKGGLVVIFLLLLLAAILFAVANFTSLTGDEGSIGQLQQRDVPAPEAQPVPADSDSANTEADYSVSPSYVTFGAAGANQTVSGQSIILTNHGADSFTVRDLVLTGADPNAFQTDRRCINQQIEPNKSCEVVVSFVPIDGGGKEAVLNVITDDSDNTMHIPLSAAASQAASFTVSPDRLDFGQQTSGGSSIPIPVQLTNNGPAPLIVYDIAIQGSHPGQFSTTLNGCANTTVAAGESCRINIVFRPNNLTSFQAELAIRTNAATPLIVPLQGGGSAPVPTLAPTATGTITPTPEPTGTATSVPSPVLFVDRTELDFGDILVGSASTSQAVTIINNGTASLTITAADITGADATDFVRTTNTCNTLSPNNSCTIEVLFQPNDDGSQQAALSIRSDINDEIRTVALQGKGTVANANLCLSTSSLNFGSQPLFSTSTEQTVILTNCGTAVLRIESITLSGTNPNDFISDNSGTQCENRDLPVGGSCGIGYRFRPIGSGDRSATITIDNTTVSGAETVDLAGVGE